MGIHALAPDPGRLGRCCERFIFIDMYGLRPVIDSFDGSFVVIGVTYLLYCTFSITNTHYTMWSHHRQSRSALTHFFFLVRSTR